MTTSPDYPVLAEVCAARTGLRIPESPVLAAQLETLAAGLLAHYRALDRRPDMRAAQCLPGEFDRIVSGAFGAELISYAEAKTLIDELAPGQTYSGFTLGMWAALADVEDANKLNGVKAELDAREPDTWLPNSPDVVTLLDKADKLGLGDKDTVAYLQGSYVHDNGLPLVLHI